MLDSGRFAIACDALARCWGTCGAGQRLLGVAPIATDGIFGRGCESAWPGRLRARFARTLSGAAPPCISRESYVQAAPILHPNTCKYHLNRKHAFEHTQTCMCMVALDIGHGEQAANAYCAPTRAFSVAVRGGGTSVPLQAAALQEEHLCTSVSRRGVCEIGVPFASACDSVPITPKRRCPAEAQGRQGKQNKHGSRAGQELPVDMEDQQGQAWGSGEKRAGGGVQRGRACRDAAM